MTDRNFIKVWALILAAGRGKRFGSGIPKQYFPLAGKPILRYSVESLTSHPAVDNVSVVINAEDQALYLEAIAGLMVTPPITGDSERQGSVRNGLETIASRTAPDHTPEFVLIHDAARPLISNTLIDRLVKELAAGQGVIPVLAITDSLKLCRGDRNFQSVSRSNLWRSQTPQIFPFSEILSAHQRFSESAMTDDHAVAEAAEMNVGTIRGDELNIKVTTSEDLTTAQRILAFTSQQESVNETVVGTGFDSHRFGPGTDIILCGTTIPFGRSLVGHSDADAGLHALTDAILGALAEGDIGVHFPSSDSRWKNMASERFLSFAKDLVLKRGAIIGNVDVTLICESPKLAPYRSAMTEKIAVILGLPNDRVNVKATTTDRLGFTGRGEGIAAQAIVTLYLPVRGDTSFD